MTCTQAQRLTSNSPYPPHLPCFLRPCKSSLHDPDNIYSIIQWKDRRSTMQRVNYKPRSLLPPSPTCAIRNTLFAPLVCALEGRNRFTFLLVQSRHCHLSVADIHLAMGVLLPRESVLHPVFVISVGEVFPSVRSSRLLAVGRSLCRLNTAHTLDRFLSFICDTYAHVSKFRSSRVSTKSEFQIMLLSLMPTSLNMPSTSWILRTPSSKLS